MNRPFPFMGGGMPRMNPFQAVQQLRQNPAQMLRQAGLNIPANMNDPNAIIQHLMNSGQVSQQSFERARQMAAQFKGRF